MESVCVVCGRESCAVKHAVLEDGRAVDVCLPCVEIGGF
jgi:hypothetical protein